MSLPGRDTSDGARGPANRAAELVAELDRQARPALVIPALGRFRVLRDGEPIASTAWQSRKARDLLTILVARRSRPTTRESLFELLWPDEDPGPLGNRLSVALATAPSVLDPERRFPAEHFIRGRRDRLSLDLDHVDLGVERFRMEAAGGARLLRSGDRPGAMARFEAAEALYAGDFLEEDPYEDWAVAMLEEAQATYIAIARALASGRPNAATPTLPRGSSSASSSATRTTRAPESGSWARSLRRGRHGEARRRYGFYATRMEEMRSRRRRSRRRSRPAAGPARPAATRLATQTAASGA